MAVKIFETVRGLLILLLMGVNTLSAQFLQEAPDYQRVDHFWWYVRDTEALRPFFRDTLGFTISADVRYSGGRRL